VNVLRRRPRERHIEAAASGARYAPVFNRSRAGSGTVLDVAVVDPAVLGGYYGRELAMGVPTVAGCRNLICGTIAQMDVDRVRGAERLPAGQLLAQPDPDVPWIQTISDTVDDLLFQGRAYWLVLARDVDGWPVRARRIPADQVVERLSPYLDDYSRVLAYEMNGAKVDPADVIAFRMDHEGVLFFGARTIARAITLYAAAERYAAVEIPAGVLINEGHELSQAEADELVENFQVQRRTKSVAYLQNVKYERTNISPADLQLVDAIDSCATEICRLFSVPVVMLGASPSGHTGSSLLYSNVGQNTSAFVGQACAPVIEAIEQALSGPTVTARGQSVVVQVGQYLRSDPSSAVDYVVALVGAGVISTDEARGVLGIPPVGVGSPTTDDLTPGRV
jgi:HK97 family phage portal protein